MKYEKKFPNIISFQNIPKDSRTKESKVGKDSCTIFRGFTVYHLLCIPHRGKVLFKGFYIGEVGIWKRKNCQMVFVQVGCCKGKFDFKLADRCAKYFKTEGCGI